MSLGQGSELVWLAFLFTGEMSLSRDAAGQTLDTRDPTASFFEQWMSTWCRKLVIARALGEVRLPLTGSAFRFKLRVQNSTYGDQLPSPAWRVGRDLRTRSLIWRDEGGRGRIGARALAPLRRFEAASLRVEAQQRDKPVRDID